MLKNKNIILHAKSAFALNMAEIIDEQEPSLFHEVVNCDK